MSVVFVMLVFLATWNSYNFGNENVFLWFFFGGLGCGVCGWVCTRWFGLQVIAENMKIYSYLHVAENPYPQDIS